MDDGFDTDNCTDYGSAYEGESDFGSDDGDDFDQHLQAVDVISALQNDATPQGLQMFEVFRERRRQANAQRGSIQAEPASCAIEAKPRTDAIPALQQASADAMGADGAGTDAMDAEMGDDSNVADDDAMGAPGDRRGSRRRQGYGRRARKRRPTHVSRGTLPPQGVDLISQANMCILRGTFQGALEPLMTCIKLYPNFTEPYTILAGAFVGMHDWAQALACYSIALHMKPSDSHVAIQCAEMSQEHGFFKQAIWAWNKYIRRNRLDRNGHVLRLQAYMALLDQQEGGRRIQRLARQALSAAYSMLQSFPGDMFVLERMPSIHYKAGRPDKAKEFLEQWVQGNRDTVDPTLLNMLAQLYTETGEYEKCLEVIGSTHISLAGCKEYADLAVKVGVCKLKVGRPGEALSFFQTLLESDQEQEDPFDAVSMHDLYLDAVSAMAQEPAAVGSAVALLRHFVSHFEAAMSALTNAEAEEEAIAGLTLPLCMERFLPMLPHLRHCVAVVSDTELHITALRLLHEHLPQSHPQYTQLMAELVTLLTTSEKGGDAALANEVLASLDEASNAAQAADNLDTQVKRAEAWLAAGCESAFLSCVSAILESEVEMERQSRDFMSKHLEGLDEGVRRRVARIQKGTVRTHSAPTPTTPAAHAARVGGELTEDEQCVIPTGSSLATTALAKDRRKAAVRELDERAQAVVDAMAGERATQRKQGAVSHVRQLVEHPAMFPMLLQVLDAKAAAGEWEWVAMHAKALLANCPRRATTEQQRRNKAILQMMLMLCRCETEAASFKLTAAEHKNIFEAWPYSLHAWGLFCRLCHKHGTMPTRVVKRLFEEHEDSLPQCLLRGHAYLLEGKHSRALRIYFKAFQMLPEDGLINLCMAVAYLQHAGGRLAGDRHAAVLKAFAFFSRYASAAGNAHEAAYNLGRAFHFLELHHLAVEWYERSLVLGQAQEGGAGVSFEAAHNLATIYEESGAVELATQLRVVYCTV